MIGYIGIWVEAKYLRIIFLRQLHTISLIASIDKSLGEIYSPPGAKS